MKKIKILLFSLILIFCTNTISFASDIEMSVNTAKSLIEYASQNMITTNSNSILNDSTKRTQAINALSKVNINDFVSKFNNLINIYNESGDITLKNVTCSFNFANGAVFFNFFISNNTFSSELPFLAIENEYTYGNHMRLGSVENEDSTFNKISYFTIGVSTLGAGGQVYGDDIINYNNLNLYSDKNYEVFEDFFYHPTIIGLTPNQTIYNVESNIDNKPYFIYNYILNDVVTSGEYVPSFPPSDEESGDSPSTSGDTGTSTPDYNNKLDNIQGGIDNVNQNLDNVNQNLDNIQNKIPTSGDIENATSNGVVSGNKEYWGSNDELTGEEQEEYISGEISAIIEDFSGDLSKNEIFKMLDHYNEQLWGIFTGETDFKIEWQDINFMGKILIPKGSINFTQICKDIEILGYVKSLINIIISFHIILALVEQIYNLILSTLGIDNPYLYENGNYTEIINVNTGERTEKIYRNRRIYRK